VTNPVITPWSKESIGRFLSAQSVAAPALGGGGATGGVNNRVLYVPFTLRESVTAKKMFWYNGTTPLSNHVDVGIYDETQAKLVSTGSTVQTGASVTQEVDIADTVIPAGRNWMAFVTDVISSNTFLGALSVSQHQWRAMGCYKNSSDVFPLPSPGVFAVGAASVFLPIFGIICGPVP
jgi:hypothetical protein